MNIQGLISFRMDWFDLLAVQGTLKSLLQHHNSKASILWCSAFFMVQLSHPYMTTGKTMALTIQTFVSKVMSLLFNMLSRFVIAFLPRSKCLLISWLQSPSAVILEPKKIKSVTVSTFSPSICHEVKGPDAMILVFWMLSFKSAFSLASFTFIKRLFSSSLLSAITVVSSLYLLLIFLLEILIPACDSSSLTFCMMFSAYKVNKQGLKNDRMISVCFQGKPFNITVIQDYAPTTNAEEAEVKWFCDDLQDLLELTARKDVLFHHRGLECKSRKPRDTWSNRQVWPWSTKWSRAKANRVLPREHIGHSKHPLLVTQEKTLHMDITRWSMSKSDWLYSL